MYLTPEQQGILDGETFGADKMVPVTSGYNHLVTSFGLNMMKHVCELMQQLIDGGVVVVDG